jgi:hypothetical protein
VGRGEGKVSSCSHTEEVIVLQMGFFTAVISWENLALEAGTYIQNDEERR